MAARFVKRTLISFLFALYEPSGSGTSKLAEWVLVYWGLDAWPCLLVKNRPHSIHKINVLCHRLSRKPTERSVPALIDIAKTLPKDSRSSRSAILNALGRAGGPKVFAALIDMLEDPKQWMKNDIVWELDKFTKSEIPSAELSKRLVQVIEREMVEKPPAWIKMTFPVLLKCKTPEADHVIRLALRSGTNDAVLEALTHATSLDPSWLDDVLYSYDIHRQSLSPLMCRTLARIPDDRSLRLLLKALAPPKENREAAEAINHMIGIRDFPVEGQTLAELERVLRESWELGSYRLQADAVTKLYDRLASTSRSIEPDASYHARMLNLWTNGTLEKLLPELSPSDGLLDAKVIPKEISYVEGTLQEILGHLEGYDRPKYKKFPGLHTRAPYFCVKHYAVIRGGYEFNDDFYGAITAVLFRWTRGTYGCCSYDHSSWLMIPRESEALGVARFSQELVMAKAER